MDFKDILRGIEPYLTMFDEVQNELLFSKVTEEELMSIMKSFKKDKSLGLYGWTIDFFIHFYDLFNSDLLEMVEEARIKGNINHIISSTFIALIPKKKFLSPSWTSHPSLFVIPSIR